MTCLLPLLILIQSNPRGVLRCWVSQQQAPGRSPLANLTASSSHAIPFFLLIQLQHCALYVTDRKVDVDGISNLM
ncbi:hypothetical protein ACFX12_044804 [Malus domestica]